MSTPSSGGYIDPQTGQYIPGEFNESIPTGGGGPGGYQERQRYRAGLKVKSQQRMEAERGHKMTLDIQERQKRVDALKHQLGNKNLSAAQKRQIQGQINQMSAYITQETRARNRSIQTQTQLQNQYYEVTGQYEKLLTGANRDAFAALKTMFGNYGLDSLAGKIYEYAKQGYGADTISLLLQDTKEYKERFSANEDRVKKGLPVLSPAEYLSVEQSYRQIMSDAGLPKGFYDNPADFRNWISGDVSPTELKGRVDLAVANTMQANQATVNALQQLYGIDKSHITAYFLDSKSALPFLQKQATAAQFGAEALKRGLQLNKQNLEDFVTAGLSLGQVSSGFQQVAEALPNIQAIAARFGDTFTQRELEKDLIEGGVTGNLEDSRNLSTNPTQKRKALASQERALFSGFGGATAGGLSGGYQPT